MLKFDKINVSFNGRYILKNFSLEIQEKEKVLLFGRSGIGKSTLLKLALGYIKPESGKIYFHDQPLNKNLIWDLRKEVAYVSQDMEIGLGKVKDYLKLVFSYKGNSHIGYSSDKVKRLIEYFELNSDILMKNIEELSGGEKQRLMIVTVLMLNRKIFFLDEITSGLDLKLKQKVISFFLENAEWTEIIVSHDNQWLSHPSVKLIDMEASFADS
ncbi:MAG: ABC transporter ATP-binding protein [Bacteroidota bacterium]|nr:ABC transporter ATP-binding protein [Bacteroidota bacterium]MDP4193985.1 ABC transporter ATP-binding protein [Bacteroidota bacterium]